VPHPKRRSVALLIETSNRYSRELVHGIRAYIQSGADWAIHLTEQGRGDVPPPWLTRWEGDGIIARIENKRIETAIRKTGLPVVSVSASGLAPDLPTVISDSEEVARLAAEHLIDRGFRHFGYCGDARFAWSAHHGRHFETVLAEHGFACSHFDSRREDFGDWKLEQRRLGSWLKSLPKPAGVMTCFDIRGQQVLDVCKRNAIAVPDQIGVIGQHDDTLLCELCDPPLSSVIPNPREAGYRAAALLDKLMSRQKVEPRVYPVAPVGVATRPSTDLVATDDPGLAAAMRFLRANALSGIGVEDLLPHAAMSRTLFERRFRTHFGRSPYDAIQFIRQKHAESLLASTELSIAEVAARCGYLTAEYFSASFKKHTGNSPSRFRSARKLP
jgi:LacI family transcriptional regulator